MDNGHCPWSLVTVIARRTGDQRPSDIRRTGNQLTRRRHHGGRLTMPWTIRKSQQGPGRPIVSRTSKPRAVSPAEARWAGLRTAFYHLLESLLSTLDGVLLRAEGPIRSLQHL